MGNEVSRPEDLSPPTSGVVPPRSPYTPTGGSSRRAQSFNSRSPSPSAAPQAPQRRTSSSSSLGSNPGSNPSSNPKKERTIQRMDKAIRRRVRGGITYNMKLLLRGAKGTGKTSLFHRLKGEPIPETHQSTPQLQSATINWSFRQNSEENVKCEVWDVVDKGFVPVSEDSAQTESAEHGGLQSGGSLSAEATSAAAAAAAAMQNGTHSMAIVDASTVDVYHEAHGVIFLLDVTKWDTLEYVKQQLDNVPVHIPTLVLGNFRDQGAQRKIFKEDIQELLYGSSDRPQHQQWRRPTELLYFECSLLNCYGLKSLHQYLGIPFLQLKLATIRQQMRIVEGEFAHLKHDVQATISEQRYAEYVEHIKATGSDIRTGRRGSGNGTPPPPVSRTNSVRLSPKENSDSKPTTKQEPADDDVSVVGKENRPDTPPKQTPPVMTTAVAETSPQESEVGKSQDAEDLPARTSSVVIQAAPPLMFEHKESVASISEEVVEDSTARKEEKPAAPERQSGDNREVTNTSPRRSRKTSVEEVVHLEDFQVPKVRTSDLDNFYSEESDEDLGEDDEDVVVAPVNGSLKASVNGIYHKQRFLDSDSSDSDEGESSRTNRRRKEKARKNSIATKPTSTSSQAVPKPVQTPSSSTPATRPKRSSRPGSPARTEPSNVVNGSNDISADTSPKQQHCLTSGVPDALTPPHRVTIPTCHACPRNDSDAGAVTHENSSLSPSQDSSKVMNGSSSSEEPELTGTESTSHPIDAQEPLDNSTVDDDVAPKVTEKIAIVTSPNINDEGVSSSVIDNTRPTTLSASEGEPEDIVRVTAYDKEHNFVKEAVRGELSDVEVDELDSGDITNRNELKTSPDKEEGNDSTPMLPQENVVATEAISTQPTPPDCLPKVFVGERVAIDKNDITEMPLSSLQTPLPAPASVQSITPELSASADLQNTAACGEVKGHYHKRNLDEAGDLLSLSVLQSSLPLPGEGAAPLSSAISQRMETSLGYSDGDNNSRLTAQTLHLSDLQMPVESKPVIPDFTSVVPNNDLEAFLNESGSDSDESPPTHAGSAAQKKNVNRRTIVESSDDEDDEDQDRFASYTISKKKRSAQRRHHKEELRQLNATLETEHQPTMPTASGVVVSESSFGTSDVMEAIRKAQEEAMRMLPTEPSPVGGEADSSSSKKHKYKHKKQHKHRKLEDGNGSKEKKTSRKSGSSSRSKKRRPHVEDDLM